MTPGRRVFSGALLLALVALGVLEWRAAAQVGAAQLQARRYEAATAWPVLQARVELERFQLAVARHVAGDADVSYDEVLLRFDILWSRIPVLDTERALSIEANETSLHAVKVEAGATLDRLDPLLQARTTARNDVEFLAHVTALAHPLALGLHQLLTEFQVTRHRLYDETQASIAALGSWHKRVVVGFFAVTTVLLVFALVETRLARRATARARANEERFRHFADSASDWLWESDAELRVTFVSERWREIFGFPETAILGRPPCAMAADPPDGAPWQQHRARLAAREPFRGFVHTHRIAAGHPRTVQVSGAPVFDGSGGFRGYRGVGSDITEKLAHEDRIRYLAEHDLLTGLLNRAAFHTRIADALEIATRGGSSFVLLVLDLDGFKKVNDTFGHDTGDRLLAEVGRRLGDTARPHPVIRLGGDEFAVLVGPGHRVKAEAVRLAGRLIAAMQTPFVLGAQQLRIGACAGLAEGPTHGRSAETLLKAADLALYQAKGDGGNGLQLFSARMGKAFERRKRLEHELRQAIDRDELGVAYQPVVRASDQMLAGAEALARWHHAELGQVSPASFIPLAEESGLILPLGQAILARACRDAAVWTGALADLPVSVNLSPAQFAQPDLVAQVGAVLEATGLEPQRLILEITETVLARDHNATIAVLDGLAESGVRLAIDDFGAGYSSLAYLRRFTAHKLKLDASFIREVETSANGRKIVRAMVMLGQSLGLTTVAEGVETRRQFLMLRDLGCDELQGFLFGRPMPLDRLMRHLAPPPQPFQRFQLAEDTGAPTRAFAP